MKRWIAMLLVIALLCGGATAVADELVTEESLDIPQETTLELEMPDASPEGIALSEDASEDIGLEIDDALLLSEDEEALILPEDGEQASVAFETNAPEDFEIDENGVLVKYHGSGGDVVIPDSVTSIGRYAFYECISLTSVVIPDSVTSIGNGAFYECRSLTSVVIPDSVTSIGYSAFSGCTSLTSVVIPNSVTSIGDLAFWCCRSLTSVVIPDSVTSIGGGAFYECRSLTSVVIPNSVTSIGGSAFLGCSSLTSVVIPDSVTSIGRYAFYECISLTSVVIPNSVTSIDIYAFDKCSNLTIYGEAGSYAETYANEHNIPFVVGRPAPAEPTALTLNKQGIVSLLPKKTLQLKATFEPAGLSAKVTWQSSAPKIAKVSSKGKVTALKKGKATVTATAEGGLSASVEIWVSQVPAMKKPTVKRKSDNAVTVNWTPLQGVSGYEVAVGKSKNATNASDIFGASKKKATLYVTPGQKLYYRVRGYLLKGKKKIYGDWSGARAFTLKRSAETYQKFGGKQFFGSNSVGNVKYTVSLLEWKHEGRTTTVKTKITFEWQKKPNTYGLDVLAMGLSGDFTNEENQAVVEYVPWNQAGAIGKKAGGYLTDKPKVERSGKGDGVYIKLTPSKVYETYYETTTVRGVKKKVKKSRYTYATTGSIVSTWSVDAPEPVTNFSIVGSYGDNQQKVKVDPSVSFTNGAVKFSVSAKLAESFEEGPLAYAKVKIKAK